MHKHRISFLHAIEGIITAVRTQPNFHVHILLSFVAIFLSVILHISYLEWAVIIFTISTGLAIELINTSIEFGVDLLTQEYKLLAKYAKDTAAGAMLAYALGAIAVAAVIFLPKLSSLWLPI